MLWIYILSGLEFFLFLKKMQDGDDMFMKGEYSKAGTGEVSNS